MPRPVTAALTALALLCLGAATPAAANAQPRAVLAFWTVAPAENFLYLDKPPAEPQDLLLRALALRPQLSIGLLGTIQGDYSEEQALLDITQGTRQSTSIYDPRQPSPLTLVRTGAGGHIDGWQGAVVRAKAASVTLRPGLLATTIPGGAAYAGVIGQSNVEAVAAADLRGAVPAVSVGPAGTLAARTQALLSRHKLVVVGLPRQGNDYSAIDALIASRAPGELLIVAYLPATPTELGFGKPPPRFLKLTAIALDGGGAPRSVTSASTRHDGLVSTIDLAPTVLDHLGLTVPKKVRGEPIEIGKRVKATRLEDLRRRWSDVRAGRQKSTLRGIVGLGVALFIALATLFGIRRAIRPTVRITALAFMWWPTMVLIAAIFEPASRLTEVAFIAFGSMALAAVGDRLLPWPRGPILPAAVGLTFLTIDLAAGGELLTRSVLGPSVLFGARYYGISNELEPLIPILAFAGIAAALTGRARSKALAGVFALSGLVLFFVVGWGRLGADVGGVLTVGFGATAATLMMLPGGITKRSLVIAALVPVAAIGGLIVLDLLASGGDHLSRNLTRSQGTSDLIELVTRRYVLAWRTLKAGATPIFTVGALLSIAFAFRNRAWLYAPLRDHAWTAALVGGLAAGIGGALTNDSGPILLENAIFALAVVTAYVQGSPRLEGAGSASVSDTAVPAPAAAGARTPEGVLST